MLWLFACVEPSDPADTAGPGPEDSAEVDDSGDSGDSGHDTGPPPPFVCPEVPDPPAAADWTLVPEIPAGSLSTLAAAGGAPVYAGSNLAGMWVLASVRDERFVEAPLPGTTHTLGDLVVDPTQPRRVYRSAGGTVTRSDDAGMSWVSTPFGSIDEGSEFPGHVYGMAVPSEESGPVYALLDSGVFGVSHDHGQSWEARGSLPDNDPGSRLDYFLRYRVLAGRTRDDALVVHDNVNVFRSTDEGWTWTAVLDPDAPPEAMARNPADPDQLRLGGLRSDDGGQTWTPAGGDAELAWWGDALYTAVGDTLTIQDAAGTRTVTLPTDAPTAVLGFGQELFAADTTTLWHSADGGAAWSAYQGSNIENNFSVVVADPHCPGVVWAGTRCDSGLYRSTDWGQSWELTPAHGHYVMDVVFDPNIAGELWLVNDNALMRSLDGGATWFHALAQFHFHGFAVDPTHPGRFLLGSVGSGEWADTQGQVYISEDQGKTLRAAEGLPPNTASAHSLVFLQGDVVLLGTYKAGDASHLSGSGIGLYRSTDRGETWSLADLDAVDIATVQEGAGAAWAATEKGVYRSDDLGVSWTLAVEGRAFWVDFEGERGLALLEDNAIWRSEDGGLSWTLDRAPDDPPYPWEESNTLARVAWAPGGEVAWWDRYGVGILWKTWAAD